MLESNPGFDNGNPVNVPLDADRFKAIGGPEEPLNVARRDGRIAEAMRDGHIPITRSKKSRLARLF